MNLEKDAREPKGFREKLTELTHALDEAAELRIATPEMYKHQMTQIVKTCETLCQKQDAEIARLKEQLAFAEATKRASDRMTSIVINIVSAYNRQAINALKEEYRLKNDMGPDEEVAEELIREGSTKQGEKQVITEVVGQTLEEETLKATKQTRPEKTKATSKRAVPRKRAKKTS